MTQPPSFARGALDLGSAGVSSARTAGGAGAPNASQQPVNNGPGGSADEVLVEVTGATVDAAIANTVTIPAVLVIHSAGLPESRGQADVMAELSRQMDGRFRVLALDVDTAPQIGQALQIQQVPLTLGVVQGQLAPLFPGMATAEQATPYVEQLLQMAVQMGVTGRVAVGSSSEPSDQLSPEHEAAFAAIENGDLEGARAAYQAALSANPKDVDAQAGLAQVNLLERTQAVDLNAARAAAAAQPTDVTAGLVVADMDLSGGHIEDAFDRLLTLIRQTTGEERDQVKERLLELFTVVGSADERVRKARTALMSALF